MRYKFLIFDTYLPDILYLREQRYEDPYLFFEAKRDPRAKDMESSGLDYNQWNYKLIAD
jgi:hypothetical protein